VERVCLRPNANRIAINAVLESGGHERVLFVDVGYTFTEIDVMSGGQLVFTRAASVHVPDDLSDEPPPPPPGPTEPLALNLDEPVRLSGGIGGGTGPSEMDKVVSALVVEVVRSIEVYRMEDSAATLNHVVVGGTTGVEEALSDALRDRFDMTSELFNPGVYFGWDAERGADACGFAAALGLAMGYADESQIHPDFLHPRKVVTAAEKQLKKLPVFGGIAAAILIVLIAAYWLAVVPQKKQLAYWEDQTQQAKENSAAGKKLRKVIKSVEEKEQQQVIWLDEVYDVLSCLPDSEELVLEDIDMRQKERQIQLKTKATSRDVLTDTVTALEKFRLAGARKGHYEAELKSTRTGPGRYPVSGRIDVTVVGHRDRPDLAALDAGRRARPTGGREDSD